MRGTIETRQIGMAMKLEANRLESPAMTGFRSGMKASCVIGRKLGAMYDVPLDMPRELEALLSALDRKLAHGRG